MDCPTIDFSQFNDTSQDQASCNSLLAGLRSYGFVKIRNHGISDEKVAELFKFTKSFFELDFETKMTVAHPPEANSNRGYSFVGQENISEISGFEKGKQSTQKLRDEKETFDMGGPEDPDWKNIWVDEQKLPGFRQSMEEFYRQCYQIQLRILRAIRVGLGLPVSRFDFLHTRGENEFRILHYPSISVKQLLDGNTTRIAEHTDFGTITLLFQDLTGGLEVENQENLGSFYPIQSSSPAEMIVNIGDSLQRWTNDTLRSACHRVTIPIQMKDMETGIVPERFSIAYFCKPNRDASLQPFAEFTRSRTPSRYKNITAWEYNQSKLTKVYQ